MYRNSLYLEHFRRSPAKCTHLFDSIRFTICQAQSHNALWNEFLMWSNETVMAEQSLLV